MTDLTVLNGTTVRMDALRQRLDFLEDCIRRAPDEVRELLVCDPNIGGLHGVILGLSIEDLLVNCKDPVEFVAYLNGQAEARFGSGCSPMFVEYHEEDRSACLYDRVHAEEVVRQRPAAFQSVNPWKDGVLDLYALNRAIFSSDEASALLHCFPMHSYLRYHEKTDYTGYFPSRGFLMSLYLIQMNKPENQTLEKDLEDYEQNGFRMLARDPKAFEKRRQELERLMKAAFEPAVSTIDEILNDREKAENYVYDSGEVDRVRSELWGQPTHARYLFEKIIVSGKLDWLRPPNRLVAYSYLYRLDQEGFEHLARIDDALNEVGYFKRIDALKKEFCNSD